MELERIDQGKEPNWTTLDDYRTLRRDKKVFIEFCDTYLSVVVGARRLQRESRYKLISEIATPSDEAIALHALDNNYEVWMEMADAQ